ncbi:hypothetical protein F4703DRAFT_1894057 [Phycomyces blakesleeanus]
MSAILRLPESTAKDVSLVYQFVKAQNVAKVESATELSLEVSGDVVEGAVTIAKYFAAKNQPELLGSSKTEQVEVEEWLSWVIALKALEKKQVVATLKKLDAHLSTRTFVALNRLTIADLLIFANVHKFSKEIKVTTMPNVLRWFDLIQNVAVKNNNIKDFDLIEINLKDVPEPVFAAPVAKKDKKAAAAGDKAAKSDEKAPKADAKAAKADEKAPKAEEKGDKKDKKDKKEKKEKKEKKPAAAPVESDQAPVSRLDIRVGFIHSCKKHPDADSLYVEEIDLGDGAGVHRTVVSGLVRWVPIEEMQNRWVICLANLKPASMRGIKSEAMVLCATANDGSKVELLAPVDTSKVQPGDRVFFEGMEGEPEKILPPKKKYWEAVQPDFKTEDDTLAYFQGKPFLIKTASGETVKCKVATVQGGGIK